MESKITLVLVLVNIVIVKATRNPAFDQSLYKEVLDPVQCEAQLAYITNNNIMLRMAFTEAGLRIPRGILLGNTLDLGNYHQCLGIDEVLQNMHIEGKYCTISLSFNSNSVRKDVPERTNFDPNMLNIEDDKLIKSIEEYETILRGVKAMTNSPEDGLNTDVRNAMTMMSFTLAVCIPKPCTTDEGISGLIFNLKELGIEYEEKSCRFRDDKPWVPVDYVAIVLLSIIGFLTLLSTSYDLWNTFILKRDAKETSKICRSFSVYTNTKRLTTFTTNPGALECIDGIRALAMIWVIIGHTFITLPANMNLVDTLNWIQSFRSLWITAAPITVDTFFMLSGLLVVYTTAGKLSGMKLLKNLHLFYLNRILRMFPLLATAILLQASVFHRIADGPQWETVASNTNACRKNWWATLLYVQNYVTPTSMCLTHTWYLAIDMQLHILSPVILFWVLSGRRKIAWSAITAALMISLTAATIYVFLKELPGTVLAPARMAEIMDYMKYYYFNTLTRASPFFVGMVFGYILHNWRGKRVEISKTLVMFLWIATFTLTTTAMCIIHPMMKFDYDNQILDSFVNSFQRPAWSMAIGWIIFACVQGYGGPINWFLCLHIWRLPSRISYGMYLFHFPILTTLAGMAIAPIYFTESYAIYHFLAHFVISFVVAFVLTLLIDSPFSTLFKLLLGEGPKKPRQQIADRPAAIEHETTATIKRGVINHAYIETETDVERIRRLNSNE